MTPASGQTGVLAPAGAASTRVSRPTTAAARLDLGWLCALALVAVGCAVIALEARGLTFSADDWQYVLDGRGLSLHVLLAPHLQHLSALPILAYRGLRATFGLASYWPYMGLLLLIHAATCLLLYAVARRYVGQWVALAPAAILVVLGPAWNDLLWAFQSAYMASVAAGLGAILCLESRTRRADGFGFALLLVSLLCSSVGLGFVVLLAVLVLLQRPRQLLRLWIPGVAGALYLLWYVTYGVSDANSGNLHRVPAYVAQAFAAAVAAVTGFGSQDHSPFQLAMTAGAVVGAIALCGLAVAVLRGHRPAPLAIASAAGLLFLWIAAALAYFPSREANQSRYQYYSAALCLVLAAAAVPGWRPSRRARGILGLATAAILIANVIILDHRGTYWRENSAFTGAEAGAMEIARGTVPARYEPINLYTAAKTGHNGLLSVAAGPYLAATAKYGSPADRPAAIARRSEPVREAADLILGGAENLRVRLAAIGAPTGRCVHAPSGAKLPAVQAGPGELAVRSARGVRAVLELRRFGSRFRYLRYGDTRPALHLPVLASGEPLRMNLPRDGAAIPWSVTMGGGRNVEVCWTAAGSA